MRYDSRQGLRGVLYADQGEGYQRIPKTIWFDDETMEWEAFLELPNGLIAQSPTYPRVPLKVSGVAKGFKFVQGMREGGLGHPQLPVPQAVDANGVILSSPFSQEDEQEEDSVASLLNQRDLRQGKRLTKYRSGMDCEHYACLRPSTWCTAVEVDKNPDRKGFIRATLIRIQYWCDWHYQPPKLLAPNGDVITEFDEITARPD